MQVSPFRRLAVAVSLSPRREALLAEAGRLAHRLGAHLLVIHVGKPSEHMHSHMEALLERQHLDDHETRLIFPTGATDDALAEICRREAVDLLVMGAVPSRTVKETLMGSLTQRTVRRAPCSVLLLANPKKKPQSINEIAICTGKEEDSPLLMELALRMAGCLQAQNIHLLSRDGRLDNPTHEHLSRMARRRKLVQAGLEEARSLVESFDDEEETEHVQPELHMKLYTGPAGKAWCEFAQRHPLDLMVVPAPPPEHLGPAWRLSHQSLSHVIAELPTNLLMLR